MVATNNLIFEFVSFKKVNECFVTIELSAENITALGELWRPSQHVLEILWKSGFVTLRNETSERTYRRSIRLAIMAIDVTRRLVHCVPMCNEPIDEGNREEVFRGFLDGTLTIRTQKELASLSNIRQTVTCSSRTEFLLAFEGSGLKSFSSTTNGTALITRDLPYSITNIKLETWHVGVLIPKQGTPIVNVDKTGEEEITSPVPPIVFVKWGRDKNSRAGSDDYFRNQLFVVFTEACRFYTSPKFKISEFFGIAVLGEYMQDDIYFRKILRSLNPYIPIPQEMLDVTRNIKEHEGKNTTTCAAIMNPVEYKCRGFLPECDLGSEKSMNEFNKKANQEGVFRCEYAQTFEGVDQIGRNSAELKEQLEQTMPCEIKHELIKRENDPNASIIDSIRGKTLSTFRATCGVKSGRPENAPVYPPDHPIWTIPVANPIRPPYHGSTIFEEVVEANFVFDSDIVTLPKSQLQLGGSKVSTYRRDVVERIVNKVKSSLGVGRFYINIPKLGKRYEIISRIFDDNETELKLKMTQKANFTAMYILCSFKDG
jgi:hypothetical protein